MRKIKQILRQKWQLELSNRAIARNIKASRDTVSEYLKRAEAASRPDQLARDSGDG